MATTKTATKSTVTATTPSTYNNCNNKFCYSPVPTVPSINFDTVRSTISIVTDALKVLKSSKDTEKVPPNLKRT